MATIHVRLPFQLYKTDEPDATVQSFNSLPPETALPYKIAAAVEVLAASLALVEVDAEAKATYAISVIHSACVYLTLLGSYLPLMSRSQNARKVSVDYSLLARTVMLYYSDNAALVSTVRELVAADTPAEALSISVLSDVEGAMAELERRHRQEAKRVGAKIEMLRKAAPAANSAAAISREASGVGNDDRDESNAAVAPPSGSQASSSSQHRSASTRRRRIRADATIPDGGEPGFKFIKHERNDEHVDTPSDAIVVKTETKRAAPRRTAASQLIVGRHRALTNGEKKAVTALNHMIDLLAHVYATRFNNLIPVLDDLQERLIAVQAIIDAERAAFEAKVDKKPPEPFHETTLDGVAAALAASTHTFREDDDCRYELDDDLLHPIAHACVEVINQIEGYRTAPYEPPTPQELAVKHAARSAAREKREAAARRAEERVRAREELAQRKEEEKRLIRARLGGALDEDELQEDATIVNPVPSAYVHYEKELPLGSPDLFCRALFIWSVIVSVPRPLLLSQMPFALFVKGLEEEDQGANGLMQEVTQCLLELSMEHVRVSSPNTPRIMTRGKNWFDALVEFVAVASGNRKKRRQQQRRAPSAASEEEEEGDDSDDSKSADSSSESESSDEESPISSSNSSVRNSGLYTSSDAKPTAEEARADAATTTGGDKVTADAATATTTEGDTAPGAHAAAAEEEEEEGDSFSVELKATMERITALRSLATWGNVDLVDRLNLLHFCVLEALASDKVRDEADKLLKEHEEDAADLERSIREARDEAEKELRGILRILPPKLASGAAVTAMKGHGKVAKGEKGEETDGEQKKADDTERNTSDEFETRKAQILAEAERKRRAAHARFFGKQDTDDVGTVIQPLGTDRYRRLYWRFPLDRRILVQTTAATAADKIPRIPEPESERQRRRGTSRFLDDEDEELMLLGSNRRRGGARSNDADAPQKDLDTTAGGSGDASADDDGQQRVWGTVAAAYLPTFIEGLDPRGEREGVLRRVLEEMTSYIQSIEAPPEGRVTRARAHNFGYVNRLKVLF